MGKYNIGTRSKHFERHWIEIQEHFKFIKKSVSVQFNLERFVEIDLNTATYHELITLLNIGEVGAASIVMARNSLKRNGRKLTLVDLTLDCGIPGDIVKEWVVSGEIQPVPRHEDSGENEQTAVLLVSIAASIQALSEAVDIVNDRQALHSVPRSRFYGKKYRTRKLEAIKYWNTPLSM